MAVPSAARHSVETVVATAAAVAEADKSTTAVTEMTAMTDLIHSLLTSILTLHLHLLRLVVEVQASTALHLQERMVIKVVPIHHPEVIIMVAHLQCQPMVPDILSRPQEVITTVPHHRTMGTETSMATAGMDSMEVTVTEDDSLVDKGTN